MTSDADATPESTRVAWLTFLGALALTAYAPLLLVLDQGLLGIFKQLAADAFYYLAVAHASADAAFLTLDGTHPVNGFHPLFQGLLVVLFAAFDLDARGELIACFALGLALTSLGAGLFALAVLQVTRSPALALLATVPGFYAWLAPSSHPEVGSLWSYVNGMESSLSIAFFGVVAYLLLARRWLDAEPRPGPLLALSALFTLMTLARLDDALIFVPFGLYALRGAASKRAALRNAFCLAALPLAVGIAYGWWNLSYAGSALPLSGLSKLSGPTSGVLRNAFHTLNTLVPFADVRGIDLEVWGREAWRILQLVLPALAALGALYTWWPRAAADTRTPVERALFLLAGYVVLRASYSFLFVALWQQGHWYFPVSILIFNLLVAAAIAALLRGISMRVPRPGAVAAACFGVLWLSANAYASSLAGSDRHVANYTFWRLGPEIQRQLDTRCAGCGLVSFDDGILAYSLTTPTLNGLGLMLDRQAYEARADGRLLTLAHSRGHRLLGTLNYPFAKHLRTGDLRAALADYPYLRGENLDSWRFTLAYLDRETGAAFIAFTPEAWLRPRRSFRTTPR